MERQKCISQRGVTSADVIVAVIIIMLFVSVITTGFYNYYKSVQSKNRITIATNIIVDVIENVEMLKYDEVTKENIDNIVKNFESDGTISKSYTVTTDLQNYNETEGNTDKKDLIKILKVKVTYGDNDIENFEVTRLITK
ncbi:MAG: hypothetical protein HFJ57_05745 [Clostridia bacterium]|nr:hypothetical protein [Clostridia bacterium]